MDHESKSFFPFNYVFREDTDTAGKLYVDALTEENLYTKQGQAIGCYTPRSLYKFFLEKYFKVNPTYVNRTRMPDVFKLSSIVSKALQFHGLSLSSERGRQYRRDQGEFYKSYRDWYDEMGATQKEVDVVKTMLTDMGYLSTYVRKAQGTPTTHWVLDTQKLLTDLRKYEAEIVVNYVNQMSERQRETAEKEKGRIQKISKIEAVLDEKPWEDPSFLESIYGNPTYADREDPYADREDALSRCISRPTQIDKCNIDTNIDTNIETTQRNYTTINSSITAGSACASPSSSVRRETEEEQPSGAPRAGVKVETPIGLPREKNTVGTERDGAFSTLGSRPPVSPTKPTGNARLVPLSPKEVPMLQVIEHWNNLPQIPDSPEYSQCPRLTKHKFDESGYVSKTVKQICELLLLIHEGNFYKANPDVQFYTKAEFDEDVVREPVPIETLNAMIEAYREYFEPGKGVADKMLLSGSLLGFIGVYEKKRRGGSSTKETRSWFWQILHHGPDVPLIRDVGPLVDVVNKKYSDVVARIGTVVSESGGNYARDKQRIPFIVAGLLAEYEYLYKTNKLFGMKSNSRWAHLFHSFQSFATVFIDFVAEKFSQGLTAGHFSAEKKMFRRHFVQYASAEYMVPMYMTKEEAKTKTMLRAKTLIESGMEDNWVNLPDGQPSYVFPDEYELIQSGDMMGWWQM